MVKRDYCSPLLRCVRVAMQSVLLLVPFRVRHCCSDLGECFFFFGGGVSFFVNLFDRKTMAEAMDVIFCVVVFPFEDCVCRAPEWRLGDGGLGGRHAPASLWGFGSYRTEIVMRYNFIPHDCHCVQVAPRAHWCSLCYHVWWL